MKKVFLGELINVDSGYAFKSNLFNTDGEGIAIIRIRDISSGEISTYYTGKYDEKYLVENGDLLVGMDGSFTIRKWKRGKALLNQRVCRVKSKNESKLLNGYLYRFLPIELKKIEDKTPFVTVKHLSAKDINNIEILVPSIKEQENIVNVLDKAQELVDKRKAQIEALDELVKSQFIEMFGNVNTNSKGWSITSMDKLIDVIGGYAFKSTEFVDEGIPVLKIGNINAGYFKSTNLMFWHKDDRLDKYLIKPGDLVISLTGTVGKDDYGNVCIMSNEYEEYYLNQRNAKLEIKSNGLIDKYYLTYLLKLPEVKQRLTGISRGVRQANIANKDILNLEVPNPPIELQNQFADFVKQVDKLKFEMQKSLKELENNFNSLMQRAFKGELFN